MKKRLRAFLTALTFSLASAGAADYYWVGGGTANSWSDAGNWEKDSVGTGTSGIPGSGDDVYIIDSGGSISVAVDSAVTVANLNVEGNVTLSGSDSLVADSLDILTGANIVIDVNAEITTITGGAATASSLTISGTLKSNSITLGSTTLENNGTIEPKTTPNALAIFSDEITNSGTITAKTITAPNLTSTAGSITAETISVTTNLSNDGNVSAKDLTAGTLANGGTVEIADSGTIGFSAYSGAGKIALGDGATLTSNATADITIGEMEFASGGGQVLNSVSKINTTQTKFNGASFEIQSGNFDFGGCSGVIGTLDITNSNCEVLFKEFNGNITTLNSGGKKLSFEDNSTVTIGNLNLGSTKLQLTKSSVSVSSLSGSGYSASISKSTLDLGTSDANFSTLQIYSAGESEIISSNLITTATLKIDPDGTASGNSIFTLPQDFKVTGTTKNNGTIKQTGGAAEFTGALTGGKYIIEDSAGGSSITTKFTGGATFTDLTADGLGGTEITFSGSFEATDSLTLKGTDASSKLDISGADFTPPTADEKINIKFAKISNSTSATQIKLKSCEDGGGNTNIDFDNACNYVWTGATDTDWKEPGNWKDEDGAPVANYPGFDPKDTAEIPSGATKWPEFPGTLTSDISINKLTVKSGAKLTIASGDNIKIVQDSDGNNGEFLNAGTVIFTDVGRVIDANDTSNEKPVNDTAHNGTIQYGDGTSAGPLTIDNFASGTNADFYNLIIADGCTVLNSGAEIAIACDAKFLGNIDSIESLAVAGTTEVGDSGGMAAAVKISTTGAQTYTGAVTLNSEAEFKSTGNGDITFEDKITGAASLAENLTVSSVGGSIEFKKAVSGVADFSADSGTGATTLGDNVSANSLDVTAASIAISGNITTKGPQDYHGAATLGAVTLTSANSGGSGGSDHIKFYENATISAAAKINSGGASIEFDKALGGTSPASLMANSSGGDVNFDGTIDGGFALTVDSGVGTTTFAAAVGGGTPLDSVSVTADSIALNGGTVKTSGAQTYTGATALGADTTLTGVDVKFDGTVEGTVKLTIDSTGGTAEFGGKVGGTNALVSIDVTADAIALNGGLVTTSGAQTYTGAATADKALTLNAAAVASPDGSNGSIKFSSSFVSAFDFTIDSGSVDFGSAEFSSGKMTIASGASFIQTGNNGTDPQSVGGIKNDGTCIWDFAEDGGTLALNGDIEGTGANADKILFNRKNVKIPSGADIEVSGIFYNLTIENGGKITNNGTITVRNNLTIEDGGNYDGSGTGVKLVLGGTTVDSTNYPSGDGDGGDGIAKITIDNANVSLGDVEISSLAPLYKRKFTSGNKTPAKMKSIDDTGFNKDLEFEFGAKITDATELQTTGIVTLGSNTDAVSEFAGGFKHTAGETHVAGKLSAPGKDIEFAETVLLEDTEFSDVGTLTIGGTLDSDSAAAANYNLTITGTGTAEFAGAVGATTPLDSLDITATAIAINGGSVTTNGTQTYTGATELGADTTLIGGAITFTGTLDGGYALVANTGSGDITFAVAGGGTSAIGGTTPLGATSLTGGAITIDGTAKMSSLVVDNSGILKTTNGSDVSVTGNLTQTGSGEVQLGGGIDCGGTASFEKDAYIFGAADSTFSAADGISIAGGNLHVSADGATKTIASALTVQNLLLYNGKLVAGSDISVLQDLILLGAKYNIADDKTDSNSGVSDLFKYDHQDRNTTIHADYSYKDGFKTALPDGTTISPYSGEFELGGNTVTVTKNFYSNGAKISGGTLQIPDNDRQSSAFAEAYYTTVTGCAASGGWVSAAEDCTDSGGNSNWDFARPRIEFAYSIYDNVIHVKFYDAATGAEKKIENSQQEIYIALASINYGGSNLFSGAFTDPECLNSTDTAGDISEFYLKAKPGEFWNTDADGNGAGAAASTDRDGNPNSVALNLNIPKALPGLYETLRDEHKNRIAHYPDYKGVEDKCAPVLISAAIGQEPHESGTSQPHYDAHNFIELRYSEPIEVGPIKDAGANENVQVTAELGAVTNKSSGVTIAGVLSTQDGRISAGSNGTPDAAGVAHALYRAFDTTGHTFRISIAGLADGSVTVDGKECTRWPYYLDSIDCEPLGGVITRLPSAEILDLKGNSTAGYAGIIETAEHPLPQISIGMHKDHPGWDLSPPVFAPFVSAGRDGSWRGEKTYYEATGSTSEATLQYLNQLEFHLFDNTPLYSDSEEYQWYFKRGWLRGGRTGTLAAKPYDAWGGSNEIYSSPAQGGGGIRKSSLAGAQAAFSYVPKGESVPRQCGAADIKQSVSSSIFGEVGTSDFIYNKDDGLYMTLSLNESDTSLPIRTMFSITYDENKAFITDLAGNRLRSMKDFQTIDRTPPTFSVLVAPIETPTFTKANKVMVVFSKRIEDKGSDNYYDGTFEIRERGGGAGPAITGVTRKFSTAESTAIVLELERNLKFEDITNLIVTLKEPESIPDSVTGVSDYVTKIQDEIGNYMVYSDKHAVSDFAVNAVEVLYAFADVTDEEGNFLEEGLYERGSYAVRDFTGDKTNYNTVLSGHDIIVAARVNAEGLSAKMHLDLAKDVNSAAVARNYNRATGSSWRLWLPTVLKVLANEANEPARELEEDSADEDDPALRKYVLSPGFAGGDEVQFMFELPIKFDHDCDGAAADGNGLTADIPLYALTLHNPNDLNSVDLWSFKVKDRTLQRGGVSIFNNVINVSVREQAVLQVDMPEDGRLSVMVMTLDGSIVKQLSKGKVSAGTHYYRWDGTNKAGNPVARGLYFVRVIGPGIDETRKVMCVKE